MRIEDAELELIEWLNRIENKVMLSAPLFYRKNREKEDQLEDLTPDRIEKFIDLVKEFEDVIVTYPE